MEVPHVVSLDIFNFERSPKVRCEENEDAIKDYRDSYTRNDRLPPPIAFEVEGCEGLLIADGRHRIRAAIEAQLGKLECVVRKGSFHDCLAVALASNTRHGLRRNASDKRLCVEKALKHWPNHSDRQIAELTKVSHDLVATVRAVMVCRGLIDRAPTRVGADGKTRTTAPCNEAIQAKCEAIVPMARQDKSEEVRHSKPVAPPAKHTRGVNCGTVPMIIHVAEILHELWESHPSWRIPAFRMALKEIDEVRDDLQLELPHVVPAKPKKLRFEPPTSETVRAWCKRDGIAESHADEFITFYASKGWKVGKNPMVSAEAAFERSKKWNSAVRVNGVGKPHVQGELLVRSIGQKEASRLTQKARRL